MTSRQPAIIELRDSGMKAQDIAATLGLTLNYVQCAIYRHDGGNEQAARTAIRAATQRLGRAITKYQLKHRT